MEMQIERMTKEEADSIGIRETQVLIEQSPDHYPEFDAVIQRELERAGGNLFFRGISGMVYRVGRVAGKPGGLRGVEICVRLTDRRAQTVFGEVIDRDLWAFLEWLIQEVGGEWSLEALWGVGAIYRIPGAPDRG
jgi:hypothetical protein